MNYKQFKIILASSSVSFIAGLIVSSVFQGNTAQVLLSSGLAALPAGFVASISTENKYQAKLNKAEEKSSDLSRKLENSRLSLSALEVSNSKLQEELEQLRKQLQNCLKESNFHKEAARQIPDLINQLTTSKKRIEELIQERDTWKTEYDAIYSEYESNFQAEVEVEVRKRVKKAERERIQQIFEESDKHCQNFLSDLEVGKELVLKYRERCHQMKAAAIAVGEASARQEKNLKEHINALLEQIEVYKSRIALLQQELAGDLTEPEYGHFGYTDDARIAEAIQRRTWDYLQIPLAAKGFRINSDGSAEVGYGYSRSQSPEALVQAISRHSRDWAKELGINSIYSIRKHELGDLLIISWRRYPKVKEDDIKLLAGSAEEFIAYIKSHPIRYRLIADPHQGKTPVTAVMVGIILEVGGTRGNTGEGKKIPHTLVSVSCPDVESSQKDVNYPLKAFLKYGDTTAAIKSFDDALADWKYRKRNTTYADTFFQLWVWDELDNSIRSASDPDSLGKTFKTILKQCHHTGVGWIVSGQSVMTSEIPGFRDDDRELFTQIIIGVTKIRKYLEKYGKKVLSEQKVSILLKNLATLEDYIDNKNAMITDSARLLRLALVLDDKSPKLYFLPNLDAVNIDYEKVENVITLANQVKSQFQAQSSGQVWVDVGDDACDPCGLSISKVGSSRPNLPIVGSGSITQNTQTPHCPHCGGVDLKVVESGKRYQCSVCKTPSGKYKRIDVKKVVWK